MPPLRFGQYTLSFIRHDEASNAWAIDMDREVWIIHVGYPNIIVMMQRLIKDVSVFAVPPNGPMHPLPYPTPRWVGMEGEVSQAQPNEGHGEDHSIGNAPTHYVHMVENVRMLADEPSPAMVDNLVMQTEGRIDAPLATNIVLDGNADMMQQNVDDRVDDAEIGEGIGNVDMEQHNMNVSTGVEVTGDDPSDGNLSGATKDFMASVNHDTMVFSYSADSDLLWHLAKVLVDS
ncbi:hypothetical protein HU200_023601 [Digitaria exilis]|uniref:Uncharacterized protein n=1 Tax=Digitaria exilis TaxID=1010633 RepID=A0A835EU88_9POAL|nr:hypothetical protein HU200_023601 [Digitaria exilis]